MCFGEEVLLGVAVGECWRADLLAKCSFFKENGDFETLNKRREAERCKGVKGFVL